MSTQVISTQDIRGAEQQALNKRLEAAGWGLFLIMLGGLGLVPQEQVAGGVWLIGAGLIMLGLNAARFWYRLKMSAFTIGLGILALFAGAGDLLGADLPLVAILLILLGVNLILKPWLERQGN